MKGGFYGLRAKQVSLILIALVCTTILIWGWEKTPLLTSLLPPQSHLLQLSPEIPHVYANKDNYTVAEKEMVNEQEKQHFDAADQVGVRNEAKGDISIVEKGDIATGAEKEMVDGQEEQHFGAAAQMDRAESSTEITKTETNVITTPVEKKEETAKDKQVSEGENSSELTDKRVDLAPMDSKSSFVEGKENSNSTTHTQKQEIPMSVIKEVDFKQISEEKNSSKQAEQSVNVVAPMGSTNTSSSVRGEDNKNLAIHREKQACNYAKGKWVTDNSWPLYSGFGCKQWLSGMWACRLTQRTDFAYEKLRWHPKNCEMEEFTGSKFLRRMQDKTLAFVGDSLGRQQFQSLMCMITGGKESPDVIDVGREYGLVKARGAARPDGWAYRFPSTNTTILYYWSASLSDLEPLDISSRTTDYAMHLDRPPAFLHRFLHKFDVLVLNTGHHWNRGKLRANRWIMHVGGVPNTNRKIADIGGAKNFTIYSIVNWVNSQLPKYPGLKVFYRSISPRHFFNGDWNTGGTCDNTAPLSGGKEVSQDESGDPIASGAVKGTRVQLLDITALSQLRDEGHISRYSIKATPGMQDCLHWCLPGVPDTWNEILFARL